MKLGYHFEFRFISLLTIFHGEYQSDREVIPRRRARMFVKMCNGKIYAVFRSCDDFYIYAKTQDKITSDFQLVKGCTYRKQIDPYGRLTEEAKIW